jgi:hypothetical protein
VQHIARNSMSLAEFLRVIADYLVWYNKRRPAFRIGRSKA